MEDYWDAVRRLKSTKIGLDHKGNWRYKKDLKLTKQFKVVVTEEMYNEVMDFIGDEKVSDGLRRLITLALKHDNVAKSK